jgi:hypothetical protein
MRALPIRWPSALASRLPGRQVLSPLALPLLAALTLNGLVLLPALRQERRTPQPQARVPADDTPELLRFSRRQALRPGLPTLALPPGAELPPPPPLVVGLPNPTPRSGGRGAAVARPSRSAGAAPRAGAKVREAPPAPAKAAEASSNGASPTAQERDKAGEAPLIAVLLTPSRLEAAEASTYESLWEQGSVALEPPATLPALPGSVQLRRLPLSKARTLGLTSPVRQSVLMAERPMLLWPDGATLWLLRLPG